MKKFKNKSILITGGTGSFGKNFINYLLKNKFPFSRIIVSSYVNNEFILAFINAVLFCNSVS